MNTHYEFEAIGTKWTIDLNLPKKTNEKTLNDKIQSRIEEFDKTYSRFREDSLTYKISQKKGAYRFPPDSRKIFDIYQRMYRKTQGKMTPLIGQLLTELGYDKNYSLKPHKTTDVPKWEESLNWQYPILTTQKKVELDFGACGKGYLIDIIGKLLLDSGISEYIIDAGGDILHHTETMEPIQIGLENPNDSTQVIGVIPLHNQAIAASSGNRRKWDKYNHIIDPTTKTSPRELLAVWVIAQDTITADALTTAIFFCDPYETTKDLSAEYLILKSDFSIQKSLNFPDTLFYNKN